MRTPKAKALFHEIADVIEKNPNGHRQFIWEQHRSSGCGTTRCIGGWAVVLSGAKLSPEGGYECATSAGSVFSTSIYASMLLDLTEVEKNALFSHSWRPKGDVTVPEALRQIADGAHPSDTFCKTVQKKELVMA